MLQAIDVSASVLYDKQMVENKFLELINACISHELRNPLNSLIAQNILKEQLYSEADKILKDKPADAFDRLKMIFLKLMEAA